MAGWRGVGGWGGYSLTGAGHNNGLSLREINDKKQYSLVDPLKLYFGDEADENSITNDVISHIYNDLYSFRNAISNNSSYMFSVNVCSLMSKFNEFREFINTLTDHKCNIIVIAVQETWDIPYPELVNIPNFNFIHKTRKLSKGGGVAFYIKQNIHYKVLNHLSHFDERVFECLTLEVTLNKKKQF